MKTLIIFAVSTAAIAAAQSKGGSSVPVITEFRDSLNPVDRIRSDGAPYRHSASISSSGHLQFLMSGRDRHRQMFLDFSDRLDLSSSSPFASGLVGDVSMNTKNYGNPGGLLTLAVGATVSRQLRVRFFDNDGKEWIIRFFGDDSPDASTRDGNCGGHITNGSTNTVQVKRVSQTQWTIAAEAGNAAACLYEGAGNVIGNPAGAFQMPFRLTLTQK